jgi:hypothetical protein
MPAYNLNWDEFAKHKLISETLKEFTHKQFSRLSQEMDSDLTFLTRF